MVGCSVGSAGSSSTSSGADQERLSRTELEQEVPSRRVTDFLEKLPTEPWFFVVLGSLIAGFALRHWFLERTLVRSISEHSDEEKGSLSRLDWWVIGELRRRALRLRARANWILLLVFTLLLGGLYVVFFVLSQVLENERVQEERLEERLRNELFRARFGEELEALVLGVHWVALNEPTLGMAAESVREAATASVEPLSETLRTGGLWSSGSLSLDGSTGLVGDSAGRVFVTRNLGNEWLSVEPGLGLSERVVYAAWSTNGDVGLLVGDQGSVLTSGDRGSSWTLREVLGLGAPSASALSGDGSTGVVGDSAGRVFVTRNLGNEWLSVEPGLGASEGVVYAAWSTNGDVGLLVGDEGSVLTSGDRGSSWTLREVLGLGAPSASALSGDGSTGLVGDSAGRVFVTRDFGNEWLSVEPELGASERVVYAAWSTNGDVGLLVGDEGSVLTSGDRGSSWTPREVLGLGAPSASALSGDGSTGLVGDSAGRVFVTRDFGNEWLSVEPELGASERVVYAAWSTDGDVGLILGGEGSLLIAEGEPVEWRTAQAKLPPIATGGDGKIALARDSDDGVFISSDGGRDWRPLRFRLPGRLTGAAIDESGTVALVTNSVGAGYVSWNAGENWLPIGAPEGALDLSFLKSPDRIVATARTLSFRGFLPRASENHFVLQRHAGLDGWEMKSSNSVLRAMIQSPTLNDSDVHLSMRQFLQEYDDRASSVGSTEGSSRPSDRDEERVGLDGVFSDLRIIQTATLAILFFLVQTLSRLHRYSLRLAAFWESRSDSVLLAQGRSEMKFDDLVRALAPDTYDFKPSPQSPLRWPRRGS